MRALKNTSPLGDLEIVGVGTVEAGATFDAGDLADGLLAQEGNYAKPEPKAKTASTKAHKTAPATPAKKGPAK